MLGGEEEVRRINTHTHTDGLAGIHAGSVLEKLEGRTPPTFNDLLRAKSE